MPTERPAHSRYGVLVAICLFTCRLVSADDAYTLEEPDTDARPRMTTVQVVIEGDVVTSGGVDKKAVRHDLQASAAYRFTERRLTGAGRDAKAFRSVRAFTQAAVRKKISDRLSESQLSPTLRLIAVHGDRQGCVRYAPHALLTRESLDLLDLPGDPLACTALLPDREVEVGEEWQPADWAVQMLCAIEAVAKSSMACTLESVVDGKAHVTFTGEIAGVRLGAPTNIELAGRLEYDLAEKLITRVSLNQAEKAAMGVVMPGIEAQTRVTVVRSPTEADGGLTETVMESIPLDPPPERLPLILNAAPWGLRLVHGRGWQEFFANYRTDPKVVILRLLDRGSFICQCNFSPVPSVDPGKHTPLEDYEASIREALGAQFQDFTNRRRVPTDDGRQIFGVTAVGQYADPSAQEPTMIPMSWTYYLVVHPSGRQVSFVFAVEPSLRERLAQRDVRVVESLLFEEPSP